jgi:hypothetical protein
MCCAYIYSGAKDLVSGKPKKSALLFLVAGFFMALSYICILVVTIIVSEQSLNTLNDIALKERTWPSGWGASMAPDKREASSKALASYDFVYSGKLGVYFDQSGGWNNYAPTEKDIKDHDQNKLDNFKIQENANYYKLLVLITLVGAGISAWFGRKVGQLENRINNMITSEP